MVSISPCVTNCFDLHLLLTCHPAPRPVFRLSYHLVSHTVSQPRPVIQCPLEQEVVPRPSHRPVCRLVCWPLPLLACQPEHQLVSVITSACLFVSVSCSTSSSVSARESESASTSPLPSVSHSVSAITSACISQHVDGVSASISLNVSVPAPVETCEPAYRQVPQLQLRSVCVDMSKRPLLQECQLQF